MTGQLIFLEDFRGGGEATGGNDPTKNKLHEDLWGVERERLERDIKEFGFHEAYAKRRAAEIIEEVSRFYEQLKFYEVQKLKDRGGAITPIIAAFELLRIKYLIAVGH